MGNGGSNIFGYNIDENRCATPLKKLKMKRKGPKTQRNIYVYVYALNPPHFSGNSMRTIGTFRYKKF